MKPGARFSDMHTCPASTPGSPPVPHVGGVIQGPGEPTVLLENLPAAVEGDTCACVGPPDTITAASATVLFNHKRAAREGDTTAHGGIIVAGAATVIIGD
ncbi:MAG: PAAR domain-containing protein [Polyangiaceae bacterium]|nr:PAAR domain-containing protein [Polyangiaceae bacterium]